jgi:two-component system, NtrC family, sensor kinase
MSNRNLNFVNKDPTHSQLSDQNDQGTIVSDYIIIMISFAVAGSVQFMKILHLEFSPKIFVMPGVMAFIFSIIVTRLRVIKRRLKHERDQKEFAKTQIQVLNQRLNELLEQRTALLIEAQDQVVVAQTRADLGAMSAGVIHDLNNALTAIKMGWEGLNYAEGTEVEECQTSITSGIDRAVTISREFSSFIRPKENETVEVKELMLRLISMLRRSMHLMQTLNLSWGEFYLANHKEPYWISSKDHPNPPTNIKLFARLTEGQLTQIMMNLIVNARDALQGKKGEVNVHITSTVTEVILSVSDNGSGMSLELQSKIFQAFFTTKPEGQGTGLGLHVLNSLIHRVNGSIYLESTEGKGTTFTIHLPRSLSKDE